MRTLSPFVAMEDRWAKSRKEVIDELMIVKDPMKKINSTQV